MFVSLGHSVFSEWLFFIRSFLSIPFDNDKTIIPIFVICRNKYFEILHLFPQYLCVEY